MVRFIAIHWFFLSSLEMCAIRSTKLARVLLVSSSSCKIIGFRYRMQDYTRVSNMKAYREHSGYLSWELLTPLSGITAAGGSFVGLLFNGLVVKFAKLSTKQILLFSIVQSVITMLLLIPQSSLACGNRNVDGFYREVDGKLVPSTELTGTFEPFPESLLDTCEMVPGGYSKCDTNVFEPICFDGVKTMQSPCHAQVKTR